MLLVKTRLGQSHIHGIGVFADQFIAKGTQVAGFDPSLDQRFTKEQILKLPKLAQIYLCKYAWKSKTTGLYCLAGDNDRFFNHSADPNTLSRYQDDKSEIVGIAIRDIEPGEELTDDYGSFENEDDNDHILYALAKEYGLKDEVDPRFKTELVTQ